MTDKIIIIKNLLLLRHNITKSRSVATLLRMNIIFSLKCLIAKFWKKCKICNKYILLISTKSFKIFSVALLLIEVNRNYPFLKKNLINLSFDEKSKLKMMIISYY